MIRAIYLLAGLLIAPAAWAQTCVGSMQRNANLSDVCTASTARTNLGLGSVATQSAASIAITGGTINGTTIGGSTPAAGTFNALSLSSTGAFYGASGTTGERPTATAGGVRFNSTTGLLEFANGSGWTGLATGSGAVSISAGAGMDFTTITGTGSVAASANTRTANVAVPVCPAGVGCGTIGAPDIYPITFTGKIAANFTPAALCRVSPAASTTVVVKKWTAGNPASSSTVCTTTLSTSCGITACVNSETSFASGDGVSIEATQASADAAAVISVTVPIVRD